MYDWFLKAEEGIALVADDGGPAGFVAGSSGGGYGRKVFRHTWKRLLASLALHPRLLFRRRTWYLWRSYLRGLRQRPAAAAATADSRPPSAGLASIAVLPEARNRGIGRSLLRAFEEEARKRGCARMTLSVEPENRSARRLYEEEGWRIDGTSDRSVHYVKELS